MKLAGTSLGSTTFIPSQAHGALRREGLLGCSSITSTPLPLLCQRCVLFFFLLQPCPTPRARPFACSGCPPATGLAQALLMIRIFLCPPTGAKNSGSDSSLSCCRVPGFPSGPTNQAPPAPAVLLPPAQARSQLCPGPGLLPAPGVWLGWSRRWMPRHPRASLLIVTSGSPLADTPNGNFWVQSVFSGSQTHLISLGEEICVRGALTGIPSAKSCWRSARESLLFFWGSFLLFFVCVFP